MDIRSDFGRDSIRGGALGTRTSLSVLDSAWDHSLGMAGAGTDGASIGATVG
jgi:hypothetical protein